MSLWVLGAAYFSGCLISFVAGGIIFYRIGWYDGQLIGRETALDAISRRMPPRQAG